MKVLLDECVPKDLCKSFPGHECYDARRMGLDGKDNGELLTAAELAGFQVLLTVDQSIPHQQNFTDRKLALLIVECHSNNPRDLLPHVPACLQALQFIKAGQVMRIGHFN